MLFCKNDSLFTNLDYTHRYTYSFAFLFPIGAAGKKNRQKERRLMKGFGPASGGSVTAPLFGNAITTVGATPLSAQTSNPLPIAAKKSSLTIAPADIAIDMTAKKSPMQR